VPHFVQVFAGEFVPAAECCPILFTKDPTDGHFYPGAIFGFKPGETLVKPEPGGFEPLLVRCDGFLFSGQQVAIDRGHGRFSETDGEPLFDDAGTPAPALRAVQRALGEVHAGLTHTRTFVAAMAEHRLIEPIEVSLTFADGERLSLQGLYTVSVDRLRDVDDATALGLFRAGHLQLAYVMAASLRHLGRLARLRNRHS
jgi:hypothetical protein